MHLKIVEKQASESFRNGKTLLDNPYKKELAEMEHNAWIESYEKEKAYWEKQSSAFKRTPPNY